MIQSVTRSAKCNVRHSCGLTLTTALVLVLTYSVALNAAAVEVVKSGSSGCPDAATFAARIDALETERAESGSFDALDRVLDGYRECATNDSFIGALTDVSDNSRVGLIEKMTRRLKFAKPAERRDALTAADALYDMAKTIEGDGQRIAESAATKEAFKRAAGLNDKRVVDSDLSAKILRLFAFADLDPDFVVSIRSIASRAFGNVSDELQVDATSALGSEEDTNDAAALDVLKTAFGSTKSQLSQAAAFAIIELGCRAGATAPFEALFPKDGTPFRARPEVQVLLIATALTTRALSSERCRLPENDTGRRVINQLGDYISSDRSVELRRAVVRSVGALGIYGLPVLPTLTSELRNSASIDVRDLIFSVQSIAARAAVAPADAFDKLVDLSKSALALEQAKAALDYVASNDKKKAFEAASLASIEVENASTHVADLSRTRLTWWRTAWAQFAGQFRHDNQWDIVRTLSILLISIYYLAAVLGGRLLVMFRPAVILRANDLLRQRTEITLYGVPLTLRTVTLSSLYYTHPAVLDAWVAEHVGVARSFFFDHTPRPYVPIAIRFHGESSSNVQALTPDKLKPVFAAGRSYVLVTGEGGCGKTVLACTLAEWGMAVEPDRRLAEHLMIPVVVDLDFEIDKASDGANGGKLIAQIGGRLAATLGLSEALDPIFLEALLRNKRVFVIFDRLSEATMNVRAAIQPAKEWFVTNAAVFVSRNDDPLDDVPHVTLEPQRLSQRDAAALLGSFLNSDAARDSINVPDRTQMELRINDIAASGVPIAFAALFTRGCHHNLHDFSFKLVPPMMIEFLKQRIGRPTSAVDVSLRSVAADAKLVAWECVRQTLQPASVVRETATAALGGDQPEERLDRLITRAGVVKTVGADESRVKFVFDPLAGYLAALYIVDVNGTDMTKWDSFTQKLGPRGAWFAAIISECLWSLNEELGDSAESTVEITRLIRLRFEDTAEVSSRPEVS